MGMLILLSPLGLFLPAHFNAGSAWGEWDSRELSAFMAADSGSKNAAIPEGLLRAEQSGWRALLPDYDLPRSNPASPAARNFSYILSAAVGVMLLGIVIMLGKNLLARKDKADGPAAVDG